MPNWHPKKVLLTVQCSGFVAFGHPAFPELAPHDLANIPQDQGREAASAPVVRPKAQPSRVAGGTSRCHFAAEPGAACAEPA
jgi:hypothetical protein